MPLDNDFWHYACTLYSLPNVADNLLILQDEYQLDVIVLLWIAWLVKEQKKLCADDWLGCLVVCQYWQEKIIGPLRQARREIKQQYPALYAQAKAVELSAERVLIAKLYQAAQHVDRSDALPITFAAMIDDYLQQTKRNLCFAAIETYLQGLK